MTDEELKAVTGKLKILKNKYFKELLEDYEMAKTSWNTTDVWHTLRYFYSNLAKSERIEKYRQKDLEEQIAEEKNEKPNIEE